MTFNKQLYGVLLTDTLPTVIDSAAEYNRIESIFETLLDKENRSPEEDKLFDLLANLLEDYERRSLSPLAKSSPLEALKFLMRQNDLAQKDLIEFFGSKGIVSEVLSGKRSISKTQAKKLAERFCVSTDLFI
jgi:HTH-type transcriptional regulator/antitoxin HigA